MLFYELLTYCRRYELVSLHHVFWSCFQHVIVTCLSCDCVLLCPQGIVRALTEFCHKLQEYSVKIFVRRGGPNYQEGLRIMRELGAALCVCLSVCLSVVVPSCLFERCRFLVQAQSWDLISMCLAPRVT